jgi:hypothetical protein
MERLFIFPRRDSLLLFSRLYFYSNTTQSNSLLFFSLLNQKLILFPIYGFIKLIYNKILQILKNLQIISVNCSTLYSFFFGVKKAFSPFIFLSSNININFKSTTKNLNYFFFNLIFKPLDYIEELYYKNI